MMLKRLLVIASLLAASAAPVLAQDVPEAPDVAGPAPATLYYCYENGWTTNLISDTGITATLMDPQPQGGGVQVGTHAGPTYMATDGGTWMFTVKVTPPETFMYDQGTMSGVERYATSIPTASISEVDYQPGSGSAIENMSLVPQSPIGVSEGTIYDEYSEMEIEPGQWALLAISRQSFGQSFDCDMKIRHTDNDGYYWYEDLHDVFHYYDMFDVRRDWYMINNEGY